MTQSSHRRRFVTTIRSTEERWDVFRNADDLVDRYTSTLIEDLDRLRADPGLIDALELIWAKLSTGHDVYLAGNGGSASTATHIAADLSQALTDCPETERCGRALPLTGSLAWMTAIANDVSYDRIFAQQLQQSARPGDALVVLSVSGTSTNVVEACRTASALNLEIVALLGSPGAVAEYAAIGVITKDPSFGRTEDIHLSIGHLMTTFVRGRHQVVHTTTGQGA
ncbi:hypothetical protein GCM10029976_032570 [Kribbella albertanoniae]|uniref:SIS domain-containing protein n=1 Tax=Kribbella albertanoniae TaxID=1266829 RepID=A0A4R4QIV1_9ACTN|nr:SIS domain-containing protein [Kribbella albertanoniae]TDC35520.1 SIS domain-containing protein [Kribbella albertanoniae]